MTPQDKQRIEKWHDGLSNEVELKLITTDDERSAKLKSFCDDLSGLAPKVRVVKDEGESNDLPALGVRSRLRYHAVPLDKELDPFLIALSSDLAKDSELLPSIPSSVETVMDQVDMPAFLTLYITQQCPFCPATVQQLLPLLPASEFIHLTITDGTLFPEAAEQHQVQSAPTLLLDDQFRWTGSVPLQEVVQMISNRDPVNLGAASLRNMLEEGNASRLAEMMLESKEVFPAFVDLLAHEKMFVRLGAMVVMETIIDKRPNLATQAVAPLWARFSNVPDQVKGDIIHVLGETGDKEVVPKLEAILIGQFGDEVKDAAKEAIEKIKK